MAKGGEVDADCNRAWENFLEWWKCLMFDGGDWQLDICQNPPKWTLKRVNFILDKVYFNKPDFKNKWTKLPSRWGGRISTLFCYCN